MYTLVHVQMSKFVILHKPTIISKNRLAKDFPDAVFFDVYA